MVPCASAREPAGFGMAGGEAQGECRQPDAVGLGYSTCAVGSVFTPAAALVAQS